MKKTELGIKGKANQVAPEGTYLAICKGGYWRETFLPVAPSYDLNLKQTFADTAALLPPVKAPIRCFYLYGGWSLWNGWVNKAVESGSYLQVEHNKRFGYPYLEKTNLCGKQVMGF